MNRREKRNLEKQMGISKYVKSLSINKKFERIRSNQENGKLRQDEFKKNVEISIQEQEDKKESDVISSLAISIAKREKIPYIDALELAKNDYSKK